MLSKVSGLWRQASGTNPMNRAGLAPPPSPQPVARSPGAMRSYRYSCRSRPAARWTRDSLDRGALNASVKKVDTRPSADRRVAGSVLYV